MAFFDTLGSKIKNAGQNIAQSTKNFADVTVYKNSISDCEKQITELYTIVGKTYYELYKNNPVPEIREYIIKINSLFQQIGELKQYIVEIEGIIQCPNCGKDIPSESLFCNNCGYKIPKEPEGRRCSNCGKPLTAGSLFCASCGTKVEQGKKKISDIGEEDTSKKRCPACHTILKEEDDFCPACGTSVNKKTGAVDNSTEDLTEKQEEV